MDEIIILDGNIVGLISDSGSARWEFEGLEDDAELYRLLVMNADIECWIAMLVTNSL